jgi:RHS repeat-associated protein
LVTYKYGTIYYNYTQLGQIDTQTNTINNESYIIDYDYTTSGALNAITYPSGRKVSYTLDLLDRITSVSVDNQVIINNVEYLAFGSFKSFDYGNGISFIADFDKDYLVRNVTHTDSGIDLFNETYGYEKMYQINAITDSVNPLKNQTFIYDAKSQLINAVGDYGTYDYTLDEVGNRTSKIFNNIDIEDYNIDTLSNKLFSIDKELLTRTLNYDANGNVIEDIGYDLISKTLTYGDNNRLIDVDGYTYGYNPMSQRVIDNGKINTYDLNGQLISVNDGNNIIEYIYLGSAKIAMLVDDGIDLKTYYAHNNYMNMPRLFTDEYKNIVWSGDFTPFGELYNENGSVNNLIRFAGQYENIESGYFYNYHRDYDAGLGRYLQSDPIGLNGGINTYAYVGGNPINFVDPLGLDLLIIRAYAPNANSSYGHTWITHIGSNGEQTNYGLWPDFLYKRIIKGDAALGILPTFRTDVRNNFEDNKSKTHEKIFYLPDNLIEIFLEQVNGLEYWYPSNNCTDWAMDVVNDTFNEDIFKSSDVSSFGIAYPELLIEKYLLKIY